MPDVVGRNPVMIAARDGLHAGAAQYAFLKNTPRLASLSRLGVLIGLFLSKSVVQSFMSSIAMNRTLGFFPSDRVLAGSLDPHKCPNVAAAPIAMCLIKSRRFKILPFKREKLCNRSLLSQLQCVVVSQKHNNIYNENLSWISILDSRQMARKQGL